jgi:hypothetical protein
MNFLGKDKWFLISCNYINPSFGISGGVLHSLLFNNSSSSFLFYSHALSLGMETNGWRY